jgi:Mrp family chromosome partitioning ATPase
MPLSFDQPADRSINGLLQYVEENREHPDILKEGICDTIPPGGISRFGHELMGSARFHQLIKELQSQYDWILMTLPKSVDSAEAESLCHITATTVITITNQTWDEVRSCLLKATEPSPKKNISFIIT